MTAYTGYILFERPELYQQPQSSSFTIPRPLAPAPYALTDISSEFAGVLTSRNAQALSHNDGAAYIMPSYADDLFNRILIVPGVLNMGNILANQTRDVEIANMYFHTVSWTALTNAVDPGITFPNLPAFAHTLLPFSDFVLKISIGPTGAPSFSGSLHFAFDVGTVDLPVSGRRLVLCQFPPQQGIVETLEWKTDIIEAYDGTEQRSGTRLSPRQRLQFSILTQERHDMNMRALMFGWLSNIFGVPIWFEQSPLLANNSAGDTVLLCDTSIYDFRVDSLAMIYQDADTYDIGQVVAMSAGSITLASVLSFDYRVGNAVVMPVRVGYAVTTPAHHRSVANTEQTDIEFIVQDNADLSNTTGAHTYQSKILLDDPNYLRDGTSTMDDAWDRPVVVIDNEQANPVQFSRVDRSRPHFVKGWALESQAEVWRVRRLLHAINGSRTTFFLPSFRHDLELVQDIGGGSVTLRCTRDGYSDFIQGLRPQGDVRVVLKNGTAYVRQVVGAVTDFVANQAVITLDSSLVGTPIHIADVDRIEIVALVRIADDKAVFNHFFAGCADVSANLVGVKS